MSIKYDMEKSHREKEFKKVEKEIKRLPDKLFGISNADKGWHESWDNGRNPLNIPHPYRVILAGPPGVGKSSTIKHLIMRAFPPFEEIFVVHCDPNGTSEYKDIGEVSMLQNIPDPESWEGKKKTMVILDDIEYRQMNKIQKRNLDRLFGYCSTHKNISVASTAQDAFSIPPACRRMANIFVLWRLQDLDSMARLAKKTGLKACDLRSIFESVCNGNRDSLWLDSSYNTPYPIRKNGFFPIERHDGKDVEKERAKSDSFLLAPKKKH